jgi:hypothetical protein
LYCIIIGDFNLDLLNYESHPKTDEFMNILVTSFFQPYILQPTRITEHTATLIDNIFFNSLEHLVISGNLIYDLTDHLPNFLIINKYSTLPNNITMFKREYSKFNESALIVEVQSIDWHTHLLPHDQNSSDLFDLLFIIIVIIIIIIIIGFI